MFSILCLLHCLILLANGTDAQKLSPPAAEFNKHRLVQPAVHHARTKREVTSTRDTMGVHYPEVTIKVPIDDNEFVLDLQLNKDLITDNHVVKYQKRGKTVTYKPKKEDIDLCQYSGTVRGVPGSWVAVSTCHGVRGVIFDGEQMRYIEPAEGEEVHSHHYVYDHSDLNSMHRRGKVVGIANHTSYGPVQDGELNRYKRSTAYGKGRGHYKSKRKPRYVELVMVADHREYIESGRNLLKVYDKLKDITNIVNAAYAPLNVFIVLVGVEVWTRKDKIKLDRNSSTTLRNFLLYRSEKLDLPNDSAHLLTQQEFDDSDIGIAPMGFMCTQYSGGVTSDYTTVLGLVAMTTAHELGHNFGMDHDEGDCECPDQECIMNGGATSYIPTSWSSCSIEALESFFENGRDHCLQ